METSDAKNSRSIENKERNREMAGRCRRASATCQRAGKARSKKKHSTRC